MHVDVMRGRGGMLITNEVQSGTIVAQRIYDRMDWGVGDIRPIAEFANPTAERALVVASIDSLEEVAATEEGLGACTDSRRPRQLLNGEPVPVRKQQAGANVVSSFFVAESLGAIGMFYKDPSAPLPQRVNEAVEYMADNGQWPSGHMSCGAGEQYGPVAANIPRFGRLDTFRRRGRFFLPEGIYDAALERGMMADYQQRAERGDYDELNNAMFLAAVERVSGRRAIAELEDDGRGVHGHVEEIVLRMRIGNRALNTARLAEITGGRQAFAINDDEMDKTASIISQENQGDGRVAQIARMAIEHHVNGAHGTLGKNLPTWGVFELRDL